MASRKLPHLTDTDSVRAEASSQYGGLSDAAAFVQQHQLGLDPDVEAASLRKVDPDATASVRDDLDSVQSKVDSEFGKGEFRVLDAAVRGDALSLVVEDQWGRPVHKVLPWTNRWRSLKGDDAGRVSAEAEGQTQALGMEARAEIARQVREATAEIMASVSKQFGGALDQIKSGREKALSEIEDDSSDEERALRNAGMAPASEGEEPVLGSGSSGSGSAGSGGRSSGTRKPSSKPRARTGNGRRKPSSRKPSSSGSSRGSRAASSDSGSGTKE